MKKLIIVLLFTVFGSSTVLSQSKNYGPLYGDVMYCMTSAWVNSKGKELILYMNGVYEFQKAYIGGWEEGIKKKEKLKKEIKEINTHFKKKTFGDIKRFINKKGKRAFRDFGGAFGVYESLQKQKIKGLKDFENYSKQLCQIIYPQVVESKYNEKFEQLISLLDKKIKRKSKLRKCMVSRTPEKIKMMVDEKIPDIKNYNISNMEKDFDKNFIKVIEEVYDKCN